MKEIYKCTVAHSVCDDWDQINIYITAGLDSKQWNIDEITHLPSLKCWPCIIARTNTT